MPTEEQTQALTTELIRRVRDTHPLVDEIDGIRVTITASYDIGIASARLLWWQSAPAHPRQQTNPQT
jgi:hypothetical protein